MFFDTLCPSVHFLTKVLAILSLNLFEMNSLNFIWILHRTLYKNIFRNMFLIYFPSFLLFSFQFCFDLSSKIKLYFYLTINKNHQNLTMKLFVAISPIRFFYQRKNFSKLGRNNLYFLFFVVNFQRKKPCCRYFNQNLNLFYSFGTNYKG